MTKRPCMFVPLDTANGSLVDEAILATRPLPSVSLL